MNELGDQSSPHLAQHAGNPVDWYPWGPGALALARELNRPILLSIGYSACHWCHVMAHESFEDDQTAAVMNAHFVNIKVDREERPDIDRVYQAAHELLTRNRGGWPLTMFLTPDDHVPFFGGTYFPREPRRGLPGFRDVLGRVAEAYAAQDTGIDAFRTQMKQALAQALDGDVSGVAIEDALPARACTQLAASFDEGPGGFGDAPKFPQPAGLELLLSESARRPEEADADPNRRMLDRTLTAMARGGIYDHLGGGFCRYAVDRDWTIPHFEKMLYDNGPLLRLYAQAAANGGDPFHATTARRTADWALQEMRAPGGGFCSSIDADSEGSEGRFYVWSREEVRDVAGDDYDLFAACYGLDGAANFEGAWHLRMPAEGLPGHARTRVAEARIEGVLAALSRRRAARVRPGLDDKILCSWNVLMIGGLACAGRLLQRGDYTDAAVDAADYLHDVHWDGNRLLAASKQGNAHLNAYLDDYAFLIDALLELLAARWRNRDLEFATALADVMLSRFEDPDRGGFYFTSTDHEALLQRSKTFADESLPAGNGVAARALLRLGHLTGDSRYLRAAEDGLQAGSASIARWPSGHAAMLLALADHCDPPALIVLRSAAATLDDEWRSRVLRATAARGAAFVIPGDCEPLPGLLADRPLLPDAAVTAYVCRGHACSAPATTLEAFDLEWGNPDA